MTEDKNIAEHLIETLEKNGVKYIFGYPGEQVLAIYEALRKSKIQHILMRHEQAAVHAADAYARITGEYGVCLATAGPGAMNLTMGTAAAYKDNVPIILISGDVDSNVKGQDTFQDIDLNSVFKPITIKSYKVNSPEKLQNNINEIFKYKKDGITGPFYINMSKDIQYKPHNTHHKIIEHEKIKLPTQNDIEDIIKSIKESEKPIIIAGSGIIYADAIEEFKEFVKKTKIPVTTSYHARGIISEKDPQNLGLQGNRSTEKNRKTTENADLILAFATKLSERTMKNVKTDNIIQINTKEEHQKCDKFYKYNIKDILIRLNEEQLPQVNHEWIEEIEKIKTEKPRKPQDTQKLNPEVVIQEILKKADENTTIILDAGTTPTYFTLHSKLDKHSQMIFPGGFGPMGYSLPASIGASFARENDIIFATTGDGSVQMTIEELAVISRYQLPVIIFIINNQSLGIIKQWQDMANNPNYEVSLDNPDFIKIAEAYDIKADNISSLDELNTKVDQAIAERKPHLFNIEVENIHIPL